MYFYYMAIAIIGVNISFLCPCMESKEKTAIVLAAWAFGLQIVFLYGGSSVI